MSEIPIKSDANRAFPRAADAVQRMLRVQDEIETSWRHVSKVQAIRFDQIQDGEDAAHDDRERGDGRMARCAYYALLLAGDEAFPAHRLQGFTAGDWKWEIAHAAALILKHPDRKALLLQVAALLIAEVGRLERADSNPLTLQTGAES